MQPLPRTIIRTSIIVIIVGGLLLYGFFRMKNLIQGPKITAISITDGLTASTSALIVQGETKNVASITLNDHPISVDKQGHFEEELLLIPGYNIIQVRVLDRFEKKKTYSYQAVFTPATTTDISISPSPLPTTSTASSTDDELVPETN